MRTFAGFSPGRALTARSLGWRQQTAVASTIFVVAGLGCAGWRDKSELLTVQVVATLYAAGHSIVTNTMQEIGRWHRRNPGDKSCG